MIKLELSKLFNLISNYNILIRIDNFVLNMIYCFKVLNYKIYFIFHKFHKVGIYSIIF